MSEFEYITFSRLYFDESIEFFFIQGVDNYENFTLWWDGRSYKVVGYLVSYVDVIENEQKNIIYLIEKEGRTFDWIIKHTRKFIENMSTSGRLTEWEDAEIIMTDIIGDSVLPPFTDFVKEVIQHEVPQAILDKIEEK
ncbi:hypothetical protein H9649_04125 [Sporosarcina sp. Sa2YVA2]|uniref:Uncharacterized protein n=1 Tax=Sporosarcina quadrami TaxID=2762234 RepID=A0ABR8U6W2_9BACL|nr:hypothetical protein [Sporosarcina quadrami]MBD7983757.1 hypothetical protein [Sporosarcina quadrami]